MAFDADEVQLIKRARLALLLHQPLSVIDTMTDYECELLLEMHHAQAELEAWAQTRTIRKARG